LNQRWSPPLRLQLSDCSIFCIMCDVPSVDVYYYYYYFFTTFLQCAEII
jgi:hypothetical protein